MKKNYDNICKLNSDGVYVEYIRLVDIVKNNIKCEVKQQYREDLMMQKCSVVCDERGTEAITKFPWISH
ncbi:hypothetical protein NGH32_09080 [Staphylococcus xylosus]|uniref:hypothetical protein n=1 Tax=Staphylococcus xylosus TaxID=1288 RepID=UPI002DB62FE9|nr:hypothetical protein [Staphylococcus xylosus]MEB8150855.1 hypothetical protein [Staphylococcus xylosus]